MWQYTIAHWTKKSKNHITSKERVTYKVSKGIVGDLSKLLPKLIKNERPLISGFMNFRKINSMLRKTIPCVLGEYELFH